MSKQIDRPKFVLVYQAGIANVFRVDTLTLAVERRNAQRMVQSDFRYCEAYCAGLIASGAIVKRAACNQAGDIADLEWTNDMVNQPFSDQYCSPLHAEVIW